MKIRSSTTLILAAVLASCALSAACSPFASSVINYAPGPSQYDGTNQAAQFMTPSNALGAPVGGTLSVANIDSVVTLGDGGSLTLAFDHDVLDDPANPGGYDFIVFGNAIFNAGNYANRWQEPGYVEISQDGNAWFLLKLSMTQTQVAALNAWGLAHAALSGYVDCTPVLTCPTNRTPEEFFTVPDRQSVAGNPDLMKVDAVSGGGDAFDIATAIRETSPGVPELDGGGNTIPAGIASFRYVRITGVHFPGTDPNLGEVSPDIDAVADVSPAITVGAARKLPEEGNYAVIYGAQVTGVFPGDGFTIEQPDRSAALKIVSVASVKEGDAVAITGHVTSDANGERTIADPLVTVLSSGAELAPVGVLNKTGASDMLSSMLVRVWGRRTAGGSESVTIDDGSGQPIAVQYGSLTTVPDTAQFVTATGIVCRTAGGTVVNIRKASDITYN